MTIVPVLVVPSASRFRLPVPALIVVALVVLVEPIVKAWAAAPVAKLIVCAVAPLNKLVVPVPDSTVRLVVAELPIDILPLLVPVLILVSKLLESFSEIAAPLMVDPAFPVSRPAAVTTPAAETLNLDVGEEPDCKSIRLPVGEAFVFEAKIIAWPEVGLPLAVTVKAELVFVPLSNLRTPEATALLELVKVYKLFVEVTANDDVSTAFLDNPPPAVHPIEVHTVFPPIINAVGESEVFVPAVNVPSSVRLVTNEPLVLPKSRLTSAAPRLAAAL